MQEYFYTEFSVFIQHIFLHKSQHESQCLIFGWLLEAFSVTDPRSLTRLQIAFTEESFQPFPGNLQQLFGIQNQVPAMSLSVRYFTHNQSCRPKCDYDFILKYWK